MVHEKQSLFRTVFAMMINPKEAMKGISETKWYFSMIISGLAFCLFFLQTGLDLYKTGQKGIKFVILSAGAGLAYGMLIIPIISFIVWVFLKVIKSDKGLLWTVSSFCLSYSGALIYGCLGLIFSLFLGWRTSVAFGVSGVLWAVGPMIVTAREMTGGKISVSVPVATIFSALVLVSWAFWGSI